MKRFHFPHRFSLRREDNAGGSGCSESPCPQPPGGRGYAAGTKGGPYLLGSRFSLADFYLSFWIAYLDREAVRSRLPSVARLYGLVRSRPGVTPYLGRDGTDGGRLCRDDEKESRGRDRLSDMRLLTPPCRNRLPQARVGVDHEARIIIVAIVCAQPGLAIVLAARAPSRPYGTRRRTFWVGASK